MSKKIILAVGILVFLFVLWEVASPSANPCEFSIPPNSQTNLQIPRREEVPSVSRNESETSKKLTDRNFRFHVYDVPSKYIEGALQIMHERWPASGCNKQKKNYTMLDWRHAHSLFTVDVFISKYLKLHPQHTTDPTAADVFIIPSMSHVYNCAGLMHYLIELLSWVMEQRGPHFKAMDHHDHYIFWWRWGMHHGSTKAFLKKMYRHFPNLNFISFDYLEIMGRNYWQDFSLALKPKYPTAQNWIVVPYPELSPLLLSSIPRHQDRKIFFYFSGTSTIGGIRRWIKRACHDHPNECTFREFATSVIDPSRKGVPVDYPVEMAQSLFCGHSQGDSLSSRRPTSAVLAGCIPVLICDLCLYPWENIIDYSKFAIFLSEKDVIGGKMFEILKAIPKEKIDMLQRGLREVRSRFVYNEGAPQERDALDSLVEQLSLRGSILRQYRRWYQRNSDLSSDIKDYPPDPKPVKRYVRKGDDEKDFNNLAPALQQLRQQNP